MSQEGCILVELTMKWMTINLLVILGPHNCGGVFECDITTLLRSFKSVTLVEIIIFIIAIRNKAQQRDIQLMYIQGTNNTYFY